MLPRLPGSERVKIRKNAYVPINPVYVVVNQCEEGDTVLQCFSRMIDAYEFALQEAQYNEVDEYAILTKELN